MAKELGDAELWLPSELLCDDFFEEARSRRADAATAAAAAAAYALGHRLASIPNTAEDCMATLTLQMAHASLVAAEKPKQSALCAWPVASMGSPKGPCHVSSPLPCLLGQQQHRENPWGLLREAAAQVMRLGHNEATRVQDLYDLGLLGPSKKPSLDLAEMPKTAEAVYLASPPVFTPLQQQQLRAAQLHYLKQQWSSAAWARQGKASGPHDLCPPVAWPAQRQQQQQQQPLPVRPGNGMRAVFFNSSATKRVSAGTGVFLPRTPGSKPEPRKTPACSSVLVPARVVQALNLSLEELGSQQRFSDGSLLEHNARNAMHQKLNHERSQPTPIAAKEFRLPQEWTY